MLLQSFKRTSDKFLSKKKKKKPEPEVTQVFGNSSRIQIGIDGLFSPLFLKEHTHAMKDMDVFSNNCGKVFFFFSVVVFMSVRKKG